MSVVNDAIKGGVCVDGISDESVTFVHGELARQSDAGHHRNPAADCCDRDLRRPSAPGRFYTAKTERRRSTTVKRRA